MALNNRHKLCDPVIVDQIAETTKFLGAVAYTVWIHWAKDDSGHG
jgi:hypothetical protein